MRILLFSDIHADRNALQQLASTPADTYICAGDLVNWARGLDQLAPILAPLGERLLLIPGNHEHATDTAAFAAQHGFRDVHSQALELGGKRWGFLGHSNPTPFNTPGEYSETELARRLNEIGPVDILVCHCPPKDTELDRGFGSTAIRAYLEEHQPTHFFCGHIHETAGVTAQLGSTFCHNLGKKGYVLDL